MTVELRSIRGRDWWGELGEVILCNGLHSWNGWKLAELYTFSNLKKVTVPYFVYCCLAHISNVKTLIGSPGHTSREGR